jgi:site-specific recombinase XerD
VFTNPERLALTRLLAGYSGLIREAYELDLRQFASWCQQHHFRLFQARRADIECFARDLEARGASGPPSHGGSARSLGSTGSRWRKTCWIICRRRMCADREWI